MKISFTSPPKIAVIGSVGSTYRTIERLIFNGMSVVAIAGIKESKSENISGYRNLSELAKTSNVPFNEFENINDYENISFIKKYTPDILFIVGISQIAKNEIMSIAKLNIGFHPTKLPTGRGRAPLAWIRFDCANAAATFFKIEEKPDAGAIIAQKPFDISTTDSSEDVAKKLHKKTEEAIDEICLNIKENKCLYLTLQNDEFASFNGIRRPSDGYIDWKMPSEKILKEIKASSHPYPGMFTTLPNGEILRIWDANNYDKKLTSYRGVTSRILDIWNNGIVVQTGDLPLLITNYTLDNGKNPQLKIGMKLGMDFFEEIQKLKNQIKILTTEINLLKAKKEL